MIKQVIIQFVLYCQYKNKTFCIFFLSGMENDGKERKMSKKMKRYVDNVSKRYIINLIDFRINRDEIQRTALDSGRRNGLYS